MTCNPGLCITSGLLHTLKGQGVKDSWPFFFTYFPEGAQPQGASAKRDPPLVLYHNLASKVTKSIDPLRNLILNKGS